MIDPAIRAEIVEPEALRQTIRPALLGNLVARVELVGADGHRIQLGEGSAAHGRVLRAVLLDKLLEQVGTFQHDAAARGRAGQIAEVLEEGRFQELLAQRAWVLFAGMDRFGSELDDGARLDVAPRVDVVAQTGGPGATRLAL